MKVPYILALEGHFPGSTSSHFLGFLCLPSFNFGMYFILFHKFLGCISFYFTNFWDVFHSISQIFGMYFILFHKFLGCISFYFYLWDVFHSISIFGMYFSHNSGVFSGSAFLFKGKESCAGDQWHLWSGRLSWISTEGSNQDGWTHVQIPHAHVAFQSLAVGDGWWWWIHVNPPLGVPPTSTKHANELSVASLLVPFNQDLEQWFSGI